VPPKTLVLFEDDQTHHFYPLHLARPVCDLVSGLFTFYERLVRLYPQNDIEIICRPELHDLVRESGRKVFEGFSPDKADDYVFINARAAFFAALKFPADTAVIDGNTLIYLCAPGRLGGWRASDFLDGTCLEKARSLGLPGDTLPFAGGMSTKNAARGGGTGVARDIGKFPYRIYNYIWELSNSIAPAIENDLLLAPPDDAPPGIASPGAGRELPGVAVLGERLSIAPDAEVDPGCVLDARAGGIVIQAGARIAQRSVITGPAVIGAGACLDGARVHGGAYIGQGCRIGGEVESSVLLAWSNKHHEGFLGHAYVGSWVNIGAMTTNSDLRNDYKAITVHLEGKPYKTGEIKLGCLIGDHAKLGIGLLLNTGATIGPCVNLYFDGALITQEVPPFVWGGRKPYTEYRLEKFIETAGAVMARRKMRLGEAMRERLERLYEHTREFRRGFLG
jgi:UDP-N-acetylglucosamine diphosphorylase/glucosamine-1-phosphate N-acetyltransferase